MCRTTGAGSHSHLISTDGNLSITSSNTIILKLQMIKIPRMRTQYKRITYNVRYYLISIHSPVLFIYIYFLKKAICYSISSLREVKVHTLNIVLAPQIRNVSLQV